MSRAANQNQRQFLRSSDLTARLGVKRDTLMAMVRRGDFPPPVQLTSTMRAWPLSVWEAWVASRPPVALAA